MIKRIPITPIFFAIVLFALAALLNRSIEKPPIVINKQDSAFNLQNSFYKFTFAGYKRLIADVLWITTLLESDTTHYKKRDLNNWMYLRFSSVLALDPEFKFAYRFAGQYLSVLKDDLLAAEKILKDGLEYYPDDYHLNFTLGFIYALELQDYEQATLYLSKIKDHPQAPRFIKSIIGKLQYAATKDLDLAYRLNLDLYEKTKDDFLKAKLSTDLYALKAMIDLECLQNNDTNCSKLDFHGEPYIREDGIWKAKQPFEEYKIYINK